MSKFTPTKGQHFYAKFNVRVFDNVDMLGTVTKTRLEDFSYSNEVLRCVGRDDTTVVAMRLSGFMADKPLLLRRDVVTFSPVGPEVMAALGLADDIDNG